MLLKDEVAVEAGGAAIGAEAGAELEGRHGGDDLGDFGFAGVVAVAEAGFGLAPKDEVVTGLEIAGIEPVLAWVGQAVASTDGGLDVPKRQDQAACGREALFEARQPSEALGAAGQVVKQAKREDHGEAIAGREEGIQRPNIAKQTR